MNLSKVMEKLRSGRHDPYLNKCAVCGVALSANATRRAYCSESCASQAAEYGYTTGKAYGAYASRGGRRRAERAQRPITLPKLTIQQDTGEVMKLYNCKSAGHPGAYIITKFDHHMNVESSYLVSNGECACPRGHAHSCRHRDMLHKFRQYKHVDDGWFLDWDTRIWHEIAISQTVDEEFQAREAHDTLPLEAPVEKEPVQAPASSAPLTPHPVSVTTGAPKLYRRLPR